MVDLEALLASLKECSDDLEEYVRAQFGERIHPSQLHRYERDMEPVLRARALLAQEQQIERFKSGSPQLDAAGKASADIRRIDSG